MRTVLTALAVLGGCQAAKRKLNTAERQTTQTAGGRIELTTLWNERGAFGLPISRKTILGASVLGLTALWAERKKAPVSAGLVLGGGLSNLLERLREGRVYDYIRFPKAPEPVRNYVFNLADFAVFAGAAGFLFRRKK